MKPLIILQFQSVFYSMFSIGDGKSGRLSQKKRLVLMAFLYVYIFFAFSSTFFTSMGSAASVLLPLGKIAVYTQVTMIFAFLFGMIGSIFLTQKMIFSARDNDFLLSLPVSPFKILISRLLALWSINLFYSGAVFVPAAIVLKNWGAPPLNVAMLITVGFGTSLLSVILTTVFAWLLELVSKKAKRKNLFGNTALIIFVLCYVVFYLNIEKLLDALIHNIGGFELITEEYTLILHYSGLAVETGSPLHLLIFVLLCAAFCAVFVFILSKSFIRIATASGSTAKYEYKRKPLKASPVQAAMTKKELSYIFGNSVYFLNACFGIFLMLALTVYVAVTGENCLALLPEEFISDTVRENRAILAPLLALIFSSICLMTQSSACSLSLEGRHFDILKSLPLGFKDIIYPKIYANLLIGAVPAVFFTLICAVRCRFTIPETLLAALTPVLAQATVAIIGICCNLRFPKFDWENEVVVVKQSASVAVSMLISMLISAAPIAVCAVQVSKLAAQNRTNLLLIFFLLYFVFTLAASCAVIATRGKKLYNNLIKK